MTKLNVEYYKKHAELLGHDAFDFNFLDVINVFDVSTTELTTEDRLEMQILWDKDGKFEGYYLHAEQAPDQVQTYYAIIESIITKLKGMNVDGDTMQYILERTGMEDQMLRQLIMTTGSDYDIECYLHDRTQTISK